MRMSCGVYAKTIIGACGCQIFLTLPPSFRLIRQRIEEDMIMIVLLAFVGGVFFGVTVMCLLSIGGN